MNGVSNELLEVYGVAPGRKSEGVTRFIYENPNEFNSRIGNNEKSEKAKEIIDELEADLVAYSDHQLNCRHKDNKNGFSQMFRGGEAKIRSVTGHNVYENVGRTQEGGTSLLCYGLSSEDRIRLLIVSTSYSEIEFYFYVLAYVHTVYIHANTCT